MAIQRFPRIVILLVSIVFALPRPTVGASPAAETVGVHVFPNVRLSAIETFLAGDRGILLGGVGSDLWRGPNDPPNQFWMVSDRGPNGEIKVHGEKRRTFPVPAFSPVILHVELKADEIIILDAIPLVDSAGRPVGGLSNIEGRDEPPYDYCGRERLACNPNGLDTEGLIRTSRGDFWLADEYSPSLIHCDARGKVLRRYVPAGLKLEGTNYPVTACLPSIYAKRKNNRGFEGLTINRDETTLYAVLQSPLSHPNKHVGKTSRNVRLLAFDIRREKPAAEYFYRLEPYERFRPSANEPSDVKLSGLAMLDDTAMLVLERTDDVARLYKIVLEGATNLLGTRWDDPVASPSLEALDQPATAGVIALSKCPVVDLAQISDIPKKIEGLAIIDARTIAVANDNDFDLGRFDTAGNNHGDGTQSLVVVIRLKQPLFDEPL